MRRSISRAGSLQRGCRLSAALAVVAPEDEFYQLLTYKDDVDLEKKLAVWERFYNNDRPHGAHKGKTPYEVLREKLS